MPVTNRILLHPQIPIILLQVFLMFVHNVTLSIRDGNPQLSTILVSLLHLAMPVGPVQIVMQVEIIRRLLPIAMHVTNRILLPPQIPIILHPGFLTFVHNVTPPIRDGNLPLSTIPSSRLLLAMPEEHVPIAILAGIIHRLLLIAMPVTSRILLLPQILIT